MPSDIPQETARRILVLAGSMDQAKQWAQSKGLRPKEWFYRARERDLHGIANVKVVIVGTFWERPDIQPIYDSVQMLVRIGHAQWLD